MTNPVVESDREAARELWRPVGRGYGFLFNTLDDGLVIQAFARHRIASTTTQDNRIAELVAENERLREGLGGFVATLTDGGRNYQSVLSVDHAALQKQVRRARTLIEGAKP